jgi:GntR family transcriptional regulator/MocR family aminotransferase
VITEGALEGVNLCTLLLSEPGDIAWVEDPGYAGQSAFAKTGLTMTGCRLMMKECAGKGSMRRSLTHFYFTFASVSLWKRAQRSPASGAAGAGPAQNAWIIEDDYDSEFRYAGEPVPAMLGMIKHAPVVYLGTFSKTLFPSLRIGFMVLPPALAKGGSPGHWRIVAWWASCGTAHAGAVH